MWVYLLSNKTFGTTTPKGVAGRWPAVQPTKLCAYTACRMLQQGLLLLAQLKNAARRSCALFTLRCTQLAASNVYHTVTVTLLLSSMLHSALAACHPQVATRLTSLPSRTSLATTRTCRQWHTPTRTLCTCKQQQQQQQQNRRIY
jgi:hypothetical protein